MQITQDELNRRINLPFEEKMEMSQCTIETWWKEWMGNVYVSFSGGKDSTVLLHLVRSLFPDVLAVFSDTGLEYPEIKSFIKSYENVKVIRPKLSFRQVIDKYGYAVVSKKIANMIRVLRHPTDRNIATRNLHTTGYAGDGRYIPDMKLPKKWEYLLDAPFEISERCCSSLKKDPFKLFTKETGLYPYLGMKATDSRLRRFSYMRTGCNIFDGKNPVSNPLSLWTEQDIFRYLIKYNIPISSVYGEIVQSESGIYRTTKMSRTGCMWCLFGIAEEKYPNRLQLLKEMHPEIYDYALNDLKMKDVLDFMGTPYG
jgi:3'-phosphoadenosine 5'-phosphosulfate sulfotransferase (PAPS reductase)/FAD synthetase